ncbi:DUF2516 family protein [Paenarthrobacter sp. CCNWLY172]|uniref:DUF2516 family protein n=1 Tax=Paenarthrobacter sp. AMU7 TaxID=3162492 RepID=A0AB39YTD6_9MICC|nr:MULTISPECIES: DUF2516 family protein [Micrococcaceae]ASN19035.1 hypothetical protein CGK93_04520 [Arthrobacter sp. YN]QSZ47793.1 hypothetical protein AYX22_04785 [Arthrobacter sp. D5-1]WGM21470.1 DUF2516 family protein [Paenarthrobacter sp. OM7]
MDGKFLIAIVTNAVYFILGLVALALEVWAFADCLRHRPTLFVAASKRTKTFWTALTGIAFAIGALTVFTGGSGLGLFGIAAVTAACVYLADVRPALREAGSGGNRNVGPYGPW